MLKKVCAPKITADLSGDPQEHVEEAMFGYRVLLLSVMREKSSG